VDGCSPPRALETRKRTKQSSVTLAPEALRPRNAGRVLRRRTRPPQISETRCPRFGGHRLDGMSSRPHVRQERQASSVRQPLEGQQRRKSPVRRCFKSRPPFGGVRRFAPAAGFFLTSDRPLVRIPANRHTTTGTCDLGNSGKYGFLEGAQAFFCLLNGNLCAL
jgi:hypothetical protein